MCAVTQHNIRQIMPKAVRLAAWISPSTFTDQITTSVDCKETSAVTFLLSFAAQWDDRSRRWYQKRRRQLKASPPVALTQRQRLACSAETHEDVFSHVKIATTHRQVETRLVRLQSEVFCQRSPGRNGRPVPAIYGTRSSKCGLPASGPRSGQFCSRNNSIARHAPRSHLCCHGTQMLVRHRTHALSVRQSQSACPT